MAVPDTNTFSFEDVRVELGGSPTYNLIQAFTDSVDVLFDPTHKGAKDRLLNFRNYSGLPIGIAFQITSNGRVDSNTACGDSTSLTKYHDGLGTFPQVSDKIFNDINLTTPFNGNSDWFKDDSTKAIEIETDGTVLTVASCGQSFNISSVGSAIADNCGDATPLTKFHDGATLDPQIGDTIYNNLELTIPFIGGSLWWKTSGLTTVQVNNSGLVLDEIIC